MAVISEVDRSYALKRIDSSMRVLHEAVEACRPEALAHVKHVAELIKSKRVTGEISAWDYRMYNLLLDEEIQDFIKRCSCKCEV